VEAACAAAATRRGETIIAVVDADADAAASDDRVTQSAQVKRSKTGLRRGGGSGHECPELRRSDGRRRRVVSGELAGVPRGSVVARRRRPIDLLTMYTHTTRIYNVPRTTTRTTGDGGGGAGGRGGDARRSDRRAVALYYYIYIRAT